MIKLSVDLKFEGLDKEEIIVNPNGTFIKQPMEQLLCGDFSSRLHVSDDFFNAKYMVPFKEVKKDPKWKTEYEKYVQTKRIHMCKSCKRKAHKGCCPEYSSFNRVMIKMVVGWNF